MKKTTLLLTLLTTISACSGNHANWREKLYKATVGKQEITIYFSLQQGIYDTIKWYYTDTKTLDTTHEYTSMLSYNEENEWYYKGGHIYLLHIIKDNKDYVVGNNLFLTQYNAQLISEE